MRSNRDVWQESSYSNLLLPIVVVLSMQLLALKAVVAEELLASSIPFESVVESSECPLPTSPAADALVARAKCGWFEVWEDRASGSGRKIKLHVMLIPATKALARPDPIFMLAGGPGQAATEAYPPLLYRLDELVKDRDVVLVDQRGTGLSSPLDCDPDYENLNILNMSFDELTHLQNQQMKTCLSGYEANPEFYGTGNAMDDLNQLRDALGHQKINLMGVSYGTRAALVYLRRYERTVRSVVIDGVVPLTRSLPAYFIRDAENALSGTIRQCEQNNECHQQFPLLREHLESLLSGLRENPHSTVVVNAITGEDEAVTIYADTVASILRLVLYSRDLSTLLPLAVEEAYKGNYKILSAIGAMFDPQTMGMSTGMQYSVLCGEDFSRTMPVDPAEPGYKFFRGSLIESMDDVCDFWPTTAVSMDYFRAVHSDVPVLLTSGELDPVTPPVWGEEAALTLVNSRHIIVPNVGHGTWAFGCMPELVAEFVANPGSQTLDATCVADIRRPAFFFNPSGPVLREGVPGGD